MNRISCLFVLAALLTALPCPAQESAATGAEELTRTLLKKGVLTEPEAQGLLERFERERREPAAAPVGLGLKGATLKFTGLGEFRFTHTAGSHKAADATTPSFKVNTARLGFAGQILPRLSYYALFAFERTNGATTGVNSALYDVKLSYAALPALTLTAGQFVMPACAETNEPTSKLDLPDRFYASGRLLNPSTNHDIGLMVHGSLFDRRLEYGAGMFNGRGPNVTANDDDDFLYAARFEGAPVRRDVLGRKAELAVGLSGMYDRSAADASQLRTDSGAAFTEEYDRWLWGYNGRLSWGGLRLKGEYLAAQLRGRHNNDPVVRADGWYAQLSQRVGRFEPLVRHQSYDPDWRAAPKRNLRWTTVGLNWFILDDNAKLQAAYTFKREKSAGTPNDELVTQFQLAF